MLCLVDLQLLPLYYQVIAADVRLKAVPVHSLHGLTTSEGDRKMAKAKWADEPYTLISTTAFSKDVRLTYQSEVVKMFHY